jgi:tetratricopeptide (TPR) repeat protein
VCSSDLIAAGRPGDAAAPLGRADRLGTGDPTDRALLVELLTARRAEAPKLTDLLALTRLLPDSVAAAANAAAALVDAGRPAAAHAVARRALVLEPGRIEPAITLTTALLRTGLPDAAYAVSRRALRSSPGDSGAWAAAALAAARVDSHGAAAHGVRAALVLDPREPSALGLAIEIASRRATGSGDGAAGVDATAGIDAARRRVRLAPGDAASWLGLAAALIAARRHEPARDPARRAAALTPGDSNAWDGLAVAEAGPLGLDGGVSARDRALAIDPDHAGARFRRSIDWLCRGRLPEAWEDYDAGLRAPAGVAPPRHGTWRFTQRIWTGEPLAGRAVLVTAEQGVGDQILFASALPTLIGNAGRVIVEAEPRLASLFARSFPAADVVPWTLPPDRPDPRLTAPDIALRVAMGSLNRHLRPRLADLPAQNTYLRAAPEEMLRRQEWLAALPAGRRVGLSWRSMKPKTAARPEEALGPTDLAPLARLAGITWVDLQYDEDAAERAALGLPLHHCPDLDLKDDLDGAAGLIASLDAVVTINNTVMNLAGALGRPTYGLIRDYSWPRLGTGAWPLIPAIRGFVAAHRASWDRSIHALAAALARDLGLALSSPPA